MCECKNDCKNCKNNANDPERRKLLGWMIALFNTAVGVAVIGPVIGFIGAPLKSKRERKWLDVMSDADLAEGTVREARVTVAVKDGFRTADRTYSLFVRKSEGAVVAYEPSCTHLGCRVSYQDDKQRFFCPCHGGVFDADGNVVGGPPPRALDRYETKVEGGRIYVSKEV